MSLSRMSIITSQLESEHFEVSHSIYGPSEYKALDGCHRLTVRIGDTDVVLTLTETQMLTLADQLDSIARSIREERSEAELDQIAGFGAEFDSNKEMSTRHPVV